MTDNTTTLVVLGGLFVVLGRWAQGKKLEAKQVIGVTVLATFLVGLSAVDQRLGKAFTVIILMAIIYAYADPIIKRLKIAD